jgi:CRISPR/Cas system-associated protein Csm6
MNLILLFGERKMFQVKMSQKFVLRLPDGIYRLNPKSLKILSEHKINLSEQGQKIRDEVRPKNLKHIIKISKNKNKLYPHENAL